MMAFIRMTATEAQKICYFPPDFMASLVMSGWSTLAN